MQINPKAGSKAHSQIGRVPRAVVSKSSPNPTPPTGDLHGVTPQPRIGRDAMPGQPFPFADVVGTPLIGARPAIDPLRLRRIFLDPGLDSDHAFDALRYYRAPPRGQMPPWLRVIVIGIFALSAWAATYLLFVVLRAVWP